MEHLRVRMLTSEMILELVEAYRTWPVLRQENKSQSLHPTKAGVSPHLMLLSL